MKKKFLICGGSGLLGLSFAFNLRDNNDLLLTTNTNNLKEYNFRTLKTDFKDFSKIKKNITIFNPDVIINTLGLTDIEVCEKNPDKAFFLNTYIPSELSKISKIIKSKFIHISTDQLFDGNKNVYSELDLHSPLNVYSQSKSLAEKKIIKFNSKALIIRANFFGYGPFYRNSFSDYIYNSLILNKKINLSKDINFNPIYIPTLINSILSLLDINERGIFNISSNNKISKYEFGLLKEKKFKLNSNLIISTVSTHSNVLRPKNMVLSNKKFLKATSIKIGTIDKQISLMHKDMNNGYFEKVKPLIPYGKHFIDKDDEKAVIQTLHSGYLTQGPEVSKFENKFAKYVGSKYAVAVSSATAGLHISSKIFKLGDKRLLATSAITFVSTSNAALHQNSKPIFCDIDPNTINISIVDLEKKLNLNNNIKVVIPVHFAGMSADMVKLKKLSKKYSFSIIEDAAHALGAKYPDGSKIGNCKYSDMAVFSLHPVKSIAAGEGGIITTNSRKHYINLLKYRSHGINKLDNRFKNINLSKTGKLNNPWYYEMQDLGFNYRLTDFQSSLASSQLDKIKLFLNKRKSIVNYYDSKFKFFRNLKYCQLSGREISSHHIYIVLINFAKIKISRAELMIKLRKFGIITQVHYIPVPLHPYYQRINKKIIIPESINYYNQALTMPIHYLLTRKQQDYIIDTLFSLIE